ncbi:MAG TPA: hypothetical protein VEP73_08880 [Actinomycetota bacterium]|nr:hypothetical protein [Actinomycetota bacterium]
MPVRTRLGTLRRAFRLEIRPEIAEISSPTLEISTSPGTRSQPRSGALSRSTRVAAALAVALLLASCTSGKRSSAPAPGQPSTSGAAAGTTTPAAPLRLDLVADAQGPERGFDPKVAARRATPAARQFLTRYVGVAFLDPGQRRAGWRDLLALFDGPLQPAARRDLDSLSLGTAAAQVKRVQPRLAKASVTFLYRGGRPVGATARLAFDGAADTEQGTGPVRLRSIFQLLWTAKGWRIAAYQSQTGASA